MNKLPKLELIVSKDSYRPMLGLIEISKESIVATDSYNMVVLNTKEILGDFVDSINTTFYITGNDWKKLNNYIHLAWKNGNIHINKNTGIDVIIPYDMDGSKYVNWKNVIPKEDSSMNLSMIGINLKHLENISKALPFDKSKFIFTGTDKAIIIKSIDTTIKSYGITMPNILE